MRRYHTLDDYGLAFAQGQFDFQEGPDPFEQEGLIDLIPEESEDEDADTE